MGKFITLCATALLLIGIATYTVLNLLDGSTTVGDNNTGIIGDDNKGNILTPPPANTSPQRNDE